MMSVLPNGGPADQPPQPRPSVALDDVSATEWRIGYLVQQQIAQLQLHSMMSVLPNGGVCFSLEAG